MLNENYTYILQNVVSNENSYLLVFSLSLSTSLTSCSLPMGQRYQISKCIKQSINFRSILSHIIRSLSHSKFDRHSIYRAFTKHLIDFEPENSTIIIISVLPSCYSSRCTQPLLLINSQRLLISWVGSSFSSRLPKLKKLGTPSSPIVFRFAMHYLAVLRSGHRRCCCCCCGTCI